MHPILFSINGFPIYSIWLASVAGLGAACAFLLVRSRCFGVSQVDLTNAAALGLAGAIAGGKVLYLATALPILWAAREILARDTALLAQLLTSGMVFYGGLFGFLLAAQWYCRRYQVDARAFWDLTAPAIPLFHAFGRVGCFLNGCCHGRVCPAFGIPFTQSLGSENGIPYFPIQLMEAAGNLLLFAVLAHFARRNPGQGQVLPAYLATYALMRFALEFCRGDAVRGIWLGLSTSQWISLVILATLAVRRFRPAHK